MRRFWIAILIMALVLGLAGCAKKERTPQVSEEEEIGEAETMEEEEVSEEESEEAESLEEKEEEAEPFEEWE